jgi:hypothetical protein
MKKFLCTASLILAFSMGSFANTNETKVVSALEAETTIDSKEKLQDDGCWEVEYTWVEYVGSTDGGTEISDGIDIKFGRITFLWCW